ncbi:MAG: hypothetical protein U1U88_001752 [Lawsonella clevelandensis]
MTAPPHPSSSTFANPKNGLKATSSPLPISPWETFRAASTDIPAGEVWVHCRLGGRAGKVCDYLNEARSDLDIHWLNEPYTNAGLNNIPVS